MFSRLGISGLAKCSHIGGILFSVEDFGRKKLQKSSQPVSCTSQLCKWNQPRKLKVDPKPVSEIVITKHYYDKQSTKQAKVTQYDPRAPCDRELSQVALQQLSSDLARSLNDSSFFLFYGLHTSKNVAVDSICENVPIDVPDLSSALNDTTGNSSGDIDLPFNDIFDISSKHFREIVDDYNECVTEEDIIRIEKETRGQSNNQMWKDLKREKLTASNFKAAAIRKKEPDLLLKRIMYINDKKTSKSLLYGNTNEDVAVQSYVASKRLKGNVGLRVWEVGTILCLERPGLGASLDRMVYDPTVENFKQGGLEVKCPYSKRDMTLEKACEDKAFYLQKKGDDIVLSKDHQYYYQIQGQMYICKLNWVDFVVWFSNKNIFIKRIYFDEEWWFKVLPKIDYFFKRAFLPEILTRRVERGIRLYNNGGWKHYKECV